MVGSLCQLSGSSVQFTWCYCLCRCVHDVPTAPMVGSLCQLPGSSVQFTWCYCLCRCVHDVPTAPIVESLCQLPGSNVQFTWCYCLCVVLSVIVWKLRSKKGFSPCSIPIFHLILVF